MKKFPNQFFFGLVLSLGLMHFHGSAQMRTNGNTNNNAAGNHVFLDASDYSSIANYPANIGKGIGFPRTDLTQWTFQTAVLDGVNYETAYDGLIVYNVGTGTTMAGQGIQVQVVPGFYYFQNPGATTTITNGQWVLIGQDAATEYAWSLEGNTATDTLHFLGTTNASDLVVKTNNAERLRLLANGNVGIGTSSPTQNLDVSGNTRLRGQLLDGSNSAGTSMQVLSSTGTSTNWIPISSTIPPGTRTLHAEYPGAVLQEDGTNNTVNINSGNFGSPDFMNYYEVNNALTTGTAQDFDIYVRLIIPANFNGWSSPTAAIRIASQGTTDASYQATIYEAGNATAIYIGGSVTGSGSFIYTDIPSSALTAFTPGDIMVIQLKLTVTSVATLRDSFIRTGDIILNYN